MKLNKYRIADIVVPFSQKCDISHLMPEQVSGINREKEFFEPSHQIGNDTSKYQIVPPNYFACNLMHVGRDVLLPIAYNHSGHEKYVSPAYTIFRLKKNCGVIDEYFILLLNSNERDRYFWFHADASVRDGMTWSDFCDIEISAPDVHVQQRYVAIYKAMQANQQSYERGLEDLRLVCEGYIDKLRTELPHERIGDYIALSEERNDEEVYTLENVRGVSIEKRFIETKADMQGVNLKPYYVVRPDAFAYVTVTSRNGEKISLAHNASKNTYICSSSYVVFTCTNTEKLLPRYLRIFFERSEFNRYARYNSWGSARETFDFSEMQDVRIPIPDIATQTALSELFDTYLARRTINEKLKKQLSAMCPILIRGSLSDGG